MPKRSDVLPSQTRASTSTVGMPTSSGQQRDDGHVGGGGGRLPRGRVPTGRLVRHRHRPELSARGDY